MIRYLSKHKSRTIRLQKRLVCSSKDSHVIEVPWRHELSQIKYWHTISKHYLADGL